uniref:Uncharacterized protein n=1 Tax=Ditylenchus dipsaci TaxID=166011 RepID=A0A915E090_9BILA
MRASSRSIWMVLLVVCASWPCGVLAEDSLPTILLKKGSSKSITQAVLVPSPDKIDLTIMPLDCSTVNGDDIVNNVKYSYSDGCNMDLIWKKGNHFHTQKDGGTSNAVETSKSTIISIWIQDKKVKFQALNEIVHPYDACPVKNNQLPGETSGYLLNFTVWSLEDLQCDYRFSFPPGYKVFVPSIDPTTVAASQALGAWDIVAICAAIVVVLVVVGIAAWCIYRYYKPVLPATAEANLSTPTAVTCLPAQKVVKPSATTQPAPVSSDLKHGVVRVPPSTAPPSSTPQPPAALPPSTATPNESDDERFQRRTRERVAKFKAVTIEIPPVPAPIIETPSKRRPSAEFRRTLESRDETELAPNTVKLERYERERSRRMLKAVDEGDQPRKKKSSSTIEDVM